MFDDLSSVPHGAIPDIDEIGPWSLVKHDIIKRYATEYAKILASAGRFDYSYVDGFAGYGVAVDRETKDYVFGSPLHALSVSPPFKKYYFVELGEHKAQFLRELTSDYPNVAVKSGDANHVLINEVFPELQYDDYKRALCVLDPYGLHLNWKVLEMAGHMGSIEIFLNFPILDINRNLVRNNPNEIHEYHMERMDAFWGDHSWFPLLYDSSPDLFGDDVQYRKEKAIRVLPQEFKRRLKEVGGFLHVAEPIAMRNTRGNIVYYLFFATQKAVAQKIVDYIFDKFSAYNA